jgi:peptide/nickel transport system permease protein
MSAITADAVPLSGRAERRNTILRRFLRHRLAVAGLVVATAFVLIAILAPLLAPADPAATDFSEVLKSPSWAHPFGTDELGRDVLSRAMYGARASLEVGLLATLIGFAIAVPLGLVAGYYGGWADPIVSRATDVTLAFPWLIVAVGLAAIVGPSLLNAAIAIGIFVIPRLVRVVRAETLGLREQEFVSAAIANGAGDPTILRRHVLPNMASTLLVQATVAIPAAIIGESVLSFLGLGVQPPTPSWGVMLSSAQPFLSLASWLAIFPGVALLLATLSFNLLGDGLRDALDPRSDD